MRLRVRFVCVCVRKRACVHVYTLQVLVTSIEQAGTVPQLVQQLVNTTYILRSCDYFGDYLGALLLL